VTLFPAGHRSIRFPLVHPFALVQPVLPVLAILVVLHVGAAAAGAATLTGRVIDPDGRAVANARVLLVTANGVEAEGTADADGNFTVSALPAGRCDLHVVAQGLQAEPTTVVLGADETKTIELRLRLSAMSESVVVSASQVEVPLSRAAGSVTVITAADLAARQIETVADALRLVPGLTVVRSGGRGGITSVFPRGGASNYTLVLVDGMRANSFGGGYDFAHLSVADVERIEIVRGPQSALFGADAIGAVVQIVTRRGGRPRAEGTLEAGSQGTRRATVGAAGSSGAWTVGGGAERTQSDGFTGVAPATGEIVSNDDYHLAHASGTFGWQHANGPDVVVNANIGRDERGFPGPFGANPIGAFKAVDRVSRGIDDTRQIGTRVTHPWSPRLRQRLDASYTDLSGNFTDAFGSSSTGTRRFDGRVQEDAGFSPEFGASAGAEFLAERGTSTFITGTAGQPIPIRRAVTGTFAELRYARHERLFVTGGVRLEHLTRQAVEADPSPFTARPAFAAQTINSFNPKVAVNYLAGPATKLHASAGTGIRPPDAFEIAFTDNPNLKPERSRSLDAGVEQQIAGGAYVIGATAFFNRYDDLLITIGRSLRDASRYRTDNISNAQSRGVEITGDARLAQALLVRASYTFSGTEILSVDGLNRVAPVPFNVGDPLIRRPRHQGAVDLMYTAKRFTGFGEITTRARTLDVEPSLGSFGGLFFSAGYTVANAGGSVRVGPGVELYARGLNLTNRGYEETLGFPALGRSGIVGVRVAASR
jgi:outer membrane cobalamin receptor